MEVTMSNPAQNSRTKNFFSSPALSLSLAGIFRGANAAGETQDDDAGSSGTGPSKAREETVEISSENSLMRSRSDDELEADGDQEDDVGDGDGKRKKKRKKYHRHTAEQIREMEVLFKESPHPDDNQRQQLSKKLGLAPRQVKFWFQNRRTQIKAIQERHENSLLKFEVEKLREENSSLRETINKSCCLNCGGATSARELSFSSEEQQLRIENAKLRAEVEKLRAAMGKQLVGSLEVYSDENGKESEEKVPMEIQSGFFTLEKTRIMEISERATEEVARMATAGEPLWVRSVETGREILNYDEYLKEFVEEDPSGRPTRSIEASRETAIVLIDLPRLVQSFMDVNQWKEMFPFLISKAAAVDVIAHGVGEIRNGAVQLMYAEIQMMTPMVATREIYFIRSCKQISAEKWAIVDVSVDKIENSIDASMAKCRKRPSGCIIDDEGNGHCKVIWVEHLECQKSAVHSAFRAIVNSGLAFGARHWISSLQLQSERLVFFMATNVPTKDSSGVATLAGRKSVLKLAQRMTCSFCRAVGGSSYNTWTKIASKNGEDIRVSSRRNVNDPGQPQGFIICAVSSMLLPVSPTVVFDFLRDESRRNEWDIMTSGGAVECVANLSKGQDKGNAVTIQAIKAKEQSMWVLQDSSTNAYESLLVYAAVDVSGMQSVITGCDSSAISLLPSGFSILPDGLQFRPLVISSKEEEKGAEGGSLLTIAYQISTGTSPTNKTNMESVESLGTLISCTLRNIRASLHCDEG